jgi:hypothetical protein
LPCQPHVVFNRAATRNNIWKTADKRPIMISIGPVKGNRADWTDCP